MQLRANRIFAGRLFGPGSESLQSEIFGLFAMAAFLTGVIYFIARAA